MADAGSAWVVDRDEDAGQFLHGDVGAAAAHIVVAFFVAQFFRHGRGQHEEAGQADIVEAVVAGLGWRMVVMAASGTMSRMASAAMVYTVTNKNDIAEPY